MISSPTSPLSPAAAPSNSSSRRDSLRWLRSWYSSARSYSRWAAASSSSASRGTPWPAAHESAAAAYGSSPSGTVSSIEMPATSIRSPSAVGSARMPGRLAGRLGERGVDVGRVVELDELGGALDDLGLAHPVAGHLVLVSAPAAEAEVRRDREVVGLLVDERQAAEHRDPLLVVVKELAQLLGRLDQEIGAFEGGVRRELSEQVVVAVHGRLRAVRGVYGWYSRSGPIRSRRNIEWWRSKIHSPARWPSARVASSFSSLSIVA